MPAVYQKEIGGVIEAALEMAFNAKLHEDYVDSPEAQRALSIAQTNFEQGLMWFRKAGYYENVKQHLDEDKGHGNEEETPKN